MRFDRTLLHESFAARVDLYLATRCGREHATALRQRESRSWSRVAVMWRYDMLRRLMALNQSTGHAHGRPQFMPTGKRDGSSTVMTNVGNSSTLWAQPLHT